MSDAHEMSLANPTSPTKRAPEIEWRAPLTLKFIAYLFILLGTLSLTNSILSMILFGGFIFDIFGILAILTGRGLLRWRNGWRNVAIFFTALWLLAGILAVPVTIWSAYSGSTTNVRMGPWQAGSGWAIATAAAMVMFAVWQFRVLQRPEIVKRFKMSPAERVLLFGARDPARPPRRWQFSLASLFLTMTIAAFVLARLTSEEVLYRMSHIMDVSWKNGVAQGVEYGVRTSRFGNQEDKLVYVLLSHESTDGRWSPNVQRERQDRLENSWIESPEGQPVRLPASTQLFEIVDGQVRTRTESITKAELDDFLGSQPDDWSLDALVKHAEAMREK